MNSKVLDESIAESLQTLDLMCFSEQYYFLVALISFGMLLVTICAEIKLLRRVRAASPRRLLDGVEAHKSTWRAGETSTRSERPLQQKRNHSHGREMATSRVDGVKAPRHSRVDVPTGHDGRHDVHQHELQFFWGPRHAGHRAAPASYLAFTPSTRVVSGRGGRGSFLFRFRGIESRCGPNRFVEGPETTHLHH